MLPGFSARGTPRPRLEWGSWAEGSHVRQRLVGLTCLLALGSGGHLDVAQALRRAGYNVDTDHSLPDHRIALETQILSWLAGH